MNNFTLMILSAGFGTRMQNLTRNIPKPLLKINNTTLIKNTINFFEKIGCNRFIININSPFLGTILFYKMLILHNFLIS